MIYKLDADFTKIEQKEGLMQNMSHKAYIEVVSCVEDPRKDSGIILQPLEKLNFKAKEDESLFARAAHIGGEHANLSVVNFNVPALGETGVGDLIDDTVTAADKTWSSEEIEKKLNAASGKDGVGIADIIYNVSTNTLDVALTDGSTKSFGDLGAKYYGGLDTEPLFVGNVTTGKTYTFSKDMINFDFLIINGSRRASLSAYQQTCQYIIPKDRWLNTNQTISEAGWSKDFTGTTLRLYHHRTGKYVDINLLANRNQFYCTSVSDLNGAPCDLITVYGVRGNSNKEVVLWDGTAGSINETEVVEDILLNDSLENYRKFGVAFNRYDVNGKQSPEYCEFLASQLKEVVEGKADFLNLCDTCKILNTSLMNEVRISSAYSAIKKIIGIY